MKVKLQEGIKDTEAENEIKKASAEGHKKKIEVEEGIKIQTLKMK